jgi:hypothetical protein
MSDNDNAIIEIDSKLEQTLLVATSMGIGGAPAIVLNHGEQVVIRTCHFA